MQVGLLQPVARLLDRGLLGAAVDMRREHADQRVAGRDHQRVVLRHQHVLEHRHAGEQADVLERARDARLLRHQVVRHALEQEQRAVAVAQAAGAALGQRLDLVPDRAVAVRERDAPLGRLVEAGDAVEHRGLAGAVRADQRGDVAAAPPRTKGRRSRRGRRSAWRDARRAGPVRVAALIRGLPSRTSRGWCGAPCRRPTARACRPGRAASRS